MFLRIELFSVVNQFFIHGLRNTVAHVFAKETMLDEGRNSIDIGAVEQNGYLLLMIKSKGEIQKNEGVSSVLSGQKQGLVLIDELAKSFDCEIDLEIDYQNNQSVFGLRIPMKYVRRKNNDEIKV